MPNEITQFGDLAFHGFDGATPNQLREAKRFLDHLETTYDVTAFRTAMQKFLVHLGAFGSDAHDIEAMMGAVDRTLILSALRDRVNTISDTQFSLAAFLRLLEEDWAFGIELARRLVLNGYPYVEGTGPVSDPFYRAAPARTLVTDIPAPFLEVSAGDLQDLAVFTEGIARNPVFNEVTVVTHGPGTVYLDLIGLDQNLREVFQKFVNLPDTTTIHLSARSTGVSLRTVTDTTDTSEAVTLPASSRHRVLVTTTRTHTRAHLWNPTSGQIATMTYTGANTIRQTLLMWEGLDGTVVNFQPNSVGNNTARVSRFAVWNQVLSDAHLQELARSGLR